MTITLSQIPKKVKLGNATFFVSKISHLEHCHPERKDWECCVFQDRQLTLSCSLPCFRLLVATPWWQNIVTVTWYRFRQVLTNVIGWQSQVHTLLSVTAWALEANTKVRRSIIIRLSDIPVYSWSHHFMQILSKLVKLNVSTDQTIFLRYAADRIYIGNVKYVALAALVHCCQCWFSVSQRSP